MLFSDVLFKKQMYDKCSGVQCSLYQYRDLATGQLFLILVHTALLGLIAFYFLE